MDDELFDLILSKAKEKNPFILAIEGRCGSGKSTIADKLARKYPATIIHLDDFFLRHSQRTPERTQEPGGNLDRERFLRQIVIPLRRGDRYLSYQIYDCKRGRMVRSKDTPLAPLVILEGSYSRHPAFGNIADLSVFLTISPEEQESRIRKRNGDTRWNIFRDLWIPLEEAYYTAFDIPEHCDLVYNTENSCLEYVSDKITA